MTSWSRACDCTTRPSDQKKTDKHRVSIVKVWLFTQERTSWNINSSVELTETIFGADVRSHHGVFVSGAAATVCRTKRPILFVAVTNVGATADCDQAELVVICCVALLPPSMLFSVGRLQQRAMPRITWVHVSEVQLKEALVHDRAAAGRSTDADSLAPWASVLHATT